MTYPIGVVADRRRSTSIGQTVQLIAKNVKYTAKAGTPEARAVAAGFSDSLLVASRRSRSQPHPERKSVLIEANALLLADIPGAASMLERAYRQPYGFDARNSAIGTTRGATGQRDAGSHRRTTRCRALVLPPPPPAVSTLPSPPITLPDVRSMFIGFHYTFAKLPDVADAPAPGRRAHRLLHDGASSTSRPTCRACRSSATRTAGASRRRIRPPRCRSRSSRSCSGSTATSRSVTASRSGRASSSGTRRSSASATRTRSTSRSSRTTPTSTRPTSVTRRCAGRRSRRRRSARSGRRVVDPRTGEILDADIGIDANNVRVVRNLRSEYMPRAEGRVRGIRRRRRPMRRSGAIRRHCLYDDAATEEAAFGLSLLEARGDLDADSPDVDRFVDDVPEERDDARGRPHARAAPQLPRVDRLHGSAARGSRFHREERHLRLGDGVQPVEPRASRARSRASTRCRRSGPTTTGRSSTRTARFRRSRKSPSSRSIASRSSEPWLAYSTDEDVAYFAVDPAVNQLDLGSDPLAYATKRLALVRELWQRTEHLDLQARRQLLGAAAQFHARTERSRARRASTRRNTSAA